VRDALVQQGEPALDALAAALLDSSTDLQVRLHIPRTISRFVSQRAADLLLEVLLNDPRGLVRYKALRGLGRMVADTALVVDPTRVEPEIRKNLIEVLRITALEVALGKPQAGLLSGPLLFGVLSDKRKQALERAFRFLQIAHRHEDIQGVYAALVGDSKARRAQALEFLDALTLVTGRERRIDPKIISLRDDIRELLVLVGDDLPARSRVARAVRFIDAPPTTASQALQQLAEDPDQTLAELAASYQGELRSPALRPRIDPPRSAPGPEGLVLSRTSPKALPIWAVPQPAREVEADDEIPRLLFLKQLMGASGSVVARLARQMTTQRFGSGETLYQALTPSTAIFFVRSGEVMQQGPGSESRRFLAPSVMGGLDALDGRPHLRTTVAVSDVEALVLTRDDWLETLEDQFEFARQFMDLLCQTLARSLLAPGAPGFSDPTPPGEPRPGLALVERLLLLRSVEAFELAAVQSLALVAQIADEVEYRAGDTIEAEGALAERLWVVASGQVEVSREQSAISGRMGPGQLVSGPASLGFKQQLFLLRASVPTTLLSIPYSGLFDIMEDHFDLTLATLLTLGNAIDRMPAVPRNEGAIEMSPTISDAMKKP
jgi:CRP-like cAMP-binding protein/HEAT repeat protein